MLMDSFTKKLFDSNLVFANSLEELNCKERIITVQATKYLKDNPIKGNFDYQHLKDIHKYLFQEVYSFAGKDRFEMGIYDSFGKRNAARDKVVWFADGIEVPLEAEKLFNMLKEKNNLKGLNFLQFTKEGADFFIKLNTLHPFREGNGRTQRIFMEQLALNAGYKLDLETKIDKQEMINACEDGMLGKNVGMIALFIKNLKPLENNLENKKILMEKNIGKERV